jgi:transposase-like protein
VSDTRYRARSHLMAEKQRVARHLLLRGLTVSQVAGQLQCSRFTVRQAQERLQAMRDLYALHAESDTPVA